MAGPLTVVQMLPALESGGVERSTLEIAAALVESGHRAWVISAGGRMLPQLLATGAQHVRMQIGRKSPRALSYVPALRRLFVDLRADVVHARSRLPAWLGRWALGTLPEAVRPRWVTTAHGLNSPSRYSAIMASGERVICVSHGVREHLLRHYRRVDPQRLRVIARGVDLAQFPRTAAREPARRWIAVRHPQLGGAGPLLLLPGRGTRLKGHVDALRLLSGLRAGGVDARLWLAGAQQAGRAAYLDQLWQLARQWEVADALAITPATDELARAYAGSDLVLQLSRKPEAFGRTVLEALAVGRPVLGWDHGGVGESLAGLQPSGAVPLGASDLLLRRAGELLTRPPPPPATIPHTLHAMQQATLAVYQELVDL